MNAGGVDKACKSSGPPPQGGELAANELVTPWYMPLRRAQRVERSANSRWSRESKVARR